MRCLKLNMLSLVFIGVTVLSRLILIGLTPPPITSYAEITPEGKVVIDKNVLENIKGQYPVIVRHLLDLVGNGRLADTLMPLNVESIVAAARSRSGLPKDAPFWFDKEAGERLTGPPDQLSSYEGTYWLSRLRVLVEATKEQALPYLSAFGRYVVRDTLIEALRVQLRIVHLTRMHPEILKEEITRPIIITGPPRTMTTHAQSILAVHPDVLYLRFSEGRDPLQPEGLDPALVHSEQDPRTNLMKVAMVVFRVMRPFAAYMFRTDEKKPGDSPQEDIFLTAMVFGSPVYDTQTYVPKYAEVWHNQDNKPAFRFQKVCQQVMQWERRNRVKANKDDPSEKRKRWLMKTPEHAGFLKDLMHVYPDALVVLTHRDPVPVVESFIPLVTYISGFWNSALDAAEFGRYQLNSLESRLNHLVEQVDSIPKSQILHVPFKEFVKDNMLVIEKICEFAGLSLNEEAVSKMQDYIDHSPREGANRFQYRISTLGEGFSREELAKRFQRYSRKFQQYI